MPCLSPPFLTVILPSHNDGEALLHTIRAVRRIFPRGLRIIIVNDGSTVEGEAEAIQGLCRRYRNVRVITHPVCLGKGAAIRDGVMVARGRLVAFMDADLVIHPAHLQEAVEMMSADRSLDMVIGRRVKYHAPFLRVFLHFLYRCFTAVLFGFPFWDTQAGLKVFRAPVARELFRPLRVFKYSFDVEILARAKALGMRVGQVDVKQRYRTLSSMSLRAMVKMALDTLVIFFRNLRVRRTRSRRLSFVWAQ